MGNKVFTIIHVDDHPIFREGFRYIIRKIPRFQLIESVNNGKLFLQLVRHHKPDLVLIDIDLAGQDCDGIDLAKEIFKHQIPSKVILLSNYITQSHFDAASVLGVHGFLMKNAEQEEIESCLNKISSGDKFYSKHCFQYLDNTQMTEQHSIKAEKLSAFHFTATEYQILGFIAKGLTTTQIAQLLKKSNRTIENHRYRISKKLNLSGSNSLVKFVLDHKRYFIEHGA